MYTVYVLQDQNKVLYKGMTADLYARLKEHRKGTTFTTSKMGPLHVVYEEEFEDVHGARSREKYLKTAAGRRFIKKKLGL